MWENVNKLSKLYMFLLWWGDDSNSTWLNVIDVPATYVKQ